MSELLPRPTVTVTHVNTGVENVKVTIARGESGRQYEVTAPSIPEAVREVIGQIIGDPYTAEWLPAAKK